MTFAYGAFALGAALLYSAFENASLMDVILGRKGESITAQGESHPSSESTGTSTGGSVGGGLVQSNAKIAAGAASGAAKGFRIPKGTSKPIAVKLAIGIEKILSMASKFPYSLGGGHEGICKPGGRGEHGGPGYDCSGCWSCVLGAMGIISAPMTSGSMAEAFAPGPGKYITLWANADHVFGRFLGIRFATGHAREAVRGGPAIGNSDDGNKAAYKECHPKGW